MKTSKKRQNIDQRQQNFFHVLDATGVLEEIGVDIPSLIPAPAPDLTPGRVDYRLQAYARFGRALKASALSRDAVAEGVSALTGKKITVTMIDNWTCTTHPHELPGWLYVPFSLVLGNSILLDGMAEATGRKVIDNHLAQAAHFLLIMSYANQQVKENIHNSPIFQGVAL